MTLKIEQRHLFGDTPEKTPTPAPLPAQRSTAQKSGPNLNLSAGLDKVDLRGESVYMLRNLGYQYQRALPHAKAKKQLLNVVRAEIHIKQGTRPPELVTMDCLLRRHLDLGNK